LKLRKEVLTTLKTKYLILVVKLISDAIEDLALIRGALIEGF
jgi:hypothetical protein